MYAICPVLGLIATLGLESATYSELSRQELALLQGDWRLVGCKLNGEEYHELKSPHKLVVKEDQLTCDWFAPYGSSILWLDPLSQEMRLRVAFPLRAGFVTGRYQIRLDQLKIGDKGGWLYFQRESK